MQVLWPHEPGRLSDLWERFVIECKVLRDSDRRGLGRTVGEGMKQTLEYMARCGAAGAGRTGTVPDGTDAGWRSGRCRARAL